MFNINFKENGTYKQITLLNNNNEIICTFQFIHEDDIENDNTVKDFLECDDEIDSDFNSDSDSEIDCDNGTGSSSNNESNSVNIDSVNINSDNINSLNNNNSDSAD